MISNVRKTPVQIACFIPMLSLLGSGCVGYRIVRTVQAEPMKTVASKQTARQEEQQEQSKTQPLAQQDQSTLNAIEDFLDRTKEFHENDTAFSSTPSWSSHIENPRDRATQYESTQPVPGYQFPSSSTQRQQFSRGMIVANGKVGLDQQGSAKPMLALPVVQSVAISLVATVGTSMPEITDANTSNQSLEAVSDLRPFSLDHYVSQLENQVSTNKDFESEWQLRMMQLVMGRDDRAQRVSDHLADESRSVLRSLMSVAVSVRDALRNSSTNTEKALTQVDELRQMIARQSDPVVSTIALCRQVVTFGVYDEMSKEDLIAGRSTQTIVYSEIDNFSSNSTVDGQFETRLGSRIELLTADGRSVWHKEEPEIVDRCRRRRKDFFIAQRVTFPATLEAGHYVLKVMVEDKLTGRANEAIYPFEIIASTSIAQGN